MNYPEATGPRNKYPYSHLAVTDPKLYKQKYDEEHADRQRRYRRSCLEADPRLQMIRKAKQRAKKKGIEFSITIDDIEVPEKCPILGLVLRPGVGKCHDASPSIDRIDSTKGYVPGNVWVISYRANTIKNNSTPSELMRVAQYMHGLEAGTL